jgi:hypothetical protein
MTFHFTAFTPAPNFATKLHVARRIAVANGNGNESAALVNLNARIPKRLWRRVRLQCVRDERLLRGFVTEALQDYLLRTRARS